MNCLEFEQRIGTDPGNLDADARSHASACNVCRAKLLDSLHFEASLRLAFGEGRQAVEDAHSMPGPVATRPPIMNRRWFVAGGAVAAAVTGFSIMQLWRDSDLADELVAHVSTESLAAGGALAQTVVQGALENAGALLVNSMLDVTYASNCIVRGQIAAHLVLASESGPMTVFLMPAVPLESVSLFERTPWIGRISPFQGGSMAVLGFNQTACADAEARLKQALSFELVKQTGEET